MRNKRTGTILSVFVLLFALANLAYADVLPYGYDSASLYFLVKYDNQTITNNFRANILACSQENCDKRDNSDECVQGQCSFNYYRVERVPSEMMLQVSLNDKNFTSGAFSFSEKRSLQEYYYTVNINPDGKMMIAGIGGDIEQYKRDAGIASDDSGSQADYTSLIIFVPALILTILIELGILIIFLRRWKVKKWKKPMLTVVLVNIISVPLIWLSFLFLALTSILLAFIIAESFAIVFEAYFFCWLNKKQIKLRQAFILSAIMNVVSFILGGVILVFISLLIGA
ncbi:MAG: hypothetical protein Q8O89_07785 [Nanoarchaeota archaeon]|nr:hypothetical protein [Nanoarchaeota archaeon]